MSHTKGLDSGFGCLYVCVCMCVCACVCACVRARVCVYIKQHTCSAYHNPPAVYHDVVDRFGTARRRRQSVSSGDCFNSLQ